MRYKPPTPLQVKWNRLLNSLIVILAVFAERVELLYLFGIINVLTLLFSMRYGPIRWLLWPVEKPVALVLDVAEAYARSYALDQSMERFEIALRIVAVSVAIAFSPCCPLLMWLIAVGMGIFMLISAFFGFCLSALGFIGFQYAKERIRVRR